MFISFTQHLYNNSVLIYKEYKGLTILLPSRQASMICSNIHIGAIPRQLEPSPSLGSSNHQGEKQKSLIGTISHQQKSLGPFPTVCCNVRRTRLTMTPHRGRWKTLQRSWVRFRSTILGNFWYLHIHIATFSCTSATLRWVCPSFAFEENLWQMYVGLRCPFLF